MYRVVACFSQRLDLAVMYNPRRVCRHDPAGVARATCQNQSTSRSNAGRHQIDWETGPSPFALSHSNSLMPGSPNAARRSPLAIHPLSLGRASHSSSTSRNRVRYEPVAQPQCLTHRLAGPHRPDRRRGRRTPVWFAPRAAGSLETPLARSSVNSSSKASVGIGGIVGKASEPLFVLPAPFCLHLWNSRKQKRIRDCRLTCIEYFPAR